MQILVTGSNGQLGRSIKKLSKNYKNLSFVFADIDSFDITDEISINSFFEEKEIDIIINCAAYTNVEYAESEPDLCCKVNHHGTKNLVSICTKKRIKLIHISTDYVFNGKSKNPYFESDKTSPISVYGNSKDLAEKEILKSSISAIILRTSWLYDTNGKNFVNTIIKASKHNKSLKVVNDQFGTPTYCTDLANICIRMCLDFKKWLNKTEIYHYSNEGFCSWYEFANEIVKICNINLKICPVKTESLNQKAARPHYSVLNKTKIKSNYKLEINDWKLSLKKYLNTINYGTDILKS